MISVLCLVLAASPDAGIALTRPGPAFVWDLPTKTIADVPIDGTTFVDGVPVRLRQLVVEGTPEDIGRFFYDSFTRQHLFVEPGQRVAFMVTGVDPNSFTTYSVVIRTTQGSRTTVVLGESRPLDRKKPEAPLPAMPEAKNALPVQFEGYALLSYQVTADEPAVRQFYDAELARRGYRKVDASNWERPSDRVELTVTAEGARRKVVVRQTTGGP